MDETDHIMFDGVPGVISLMASSDCLLVYVRSINDHTKSMVESFQDYF